MTVIAAMITNFTFINIYMNIIFSNAYFLTLDKLRKVHVYVGTVKNE